MLCSAPAMSSWICSTSALTAPMSAPLAFKASSAALSASLAASRASCLTLTCTRQTLPTERDLQRHWPYSELVSY